MNPKQLFEYFCQLLAEKKYLKFILSVFGLLIITFLSAILVYYLTVNFVTFISIHFDTIFIGGGAIGFFAWYIREKSKQKAKVIQQQQDEAEKQAEFVEAEQVIRNYNVMLDTLFFVVKDSSITTSLGLIVPPNKSDLACAVKTVDISAVKMAQFCLIRGSGDVNIANVVAVLNKQISSRLRAGLVPSISGAEQIINGNTYAAIIVDSVIDNANGTLTLRMVLLSKKYVALCEAREEQRRNNFFKGNDHSDSNRKDDDF